MRARSAILLAAGGLTVGACRLSLDASLIDDDGSEDAGGGTGGDDGGAGAPGGSAGTPGGSGGFGTGGSSATGGTGGGTGGEAGSSIECTSDGDCTSADGCLEGACSFGRCVFDVCPSTAACTARACDTTSRTCREETAVGFHAGQLDVGDAVGCSNVPARCIAAMGRYVFVGTVGGLRAWRVTNPLEPQPIAIEEPPFPIGWLVASERRVLAVGPALSGKLSVAWIDHPADPTVEELVASSALVDFDGSIEAVYPAGSDAFHLVRASAAELFPTARVSPPFRNGDTIVQHASTGIPTGSTVVAASGSRLVAYRTDTTATLDPVFSLIADAGTAAAQAQPEQNLGSSSGEAPTSLAAHVFAASPQGAVAWLTNAVVRGGDAGAPLTSSLEARWPVVDDGDDAFDGSRRVEVESYPMQVDANTLLAGPSAVIDDANLLVTVANPGDTAQSIVKRVERAGDTLTLSPTQSWLLGFPTIRLGVATGANFAYVLTPNAADPGEPPDTTLHVFDAGCED